MTSKRALHKKRKHMQSMENTFQTKFIRSKNTEDQEQNNQYVVTVLCTEAVLLQVMFHLHH